MMCSHSALTFLTGGEYVTKSRFGHVDPFQISEWLQTFGNLIFMIFLH